jgi:rhodanese-related sulfurtransferase
MAAGREIDTITSISAEDLAKKIKKEKVAIVDVRRASEYNSEHIENAINAPLDYLKDSTSKLDKDKTYYVHCRSGYRSMVFTSILRTKGYKHLVDINGGIEAIKKNGQFQISEYIAPTTML